MFHSKISARIPNAIPLEHGSTRVTNMLWVNPVSEIGFDIPDGKVTSAAYMDQRNDPACPRPTSLTHRTIFSIVMHKRFAEMIDRTSSNIRHYPLHLAAKNNHRVRGNFKTRGCR